MAMKTQWLDVSYIGIQKQPSASTEWHLETARRNNLNTTMNYEPASCEPFKKPALPN